MNIRKTTLNDIPRLKEIFNIARQFMMRSGNPNQWDSSYPSIAQLTEDIESGESYVCIYENRIVATFLLKSGNDPTYDIIYDGNWKNDEPYATIHRIASSGEVKGIFHKVMDFALERFDNIRIDTHQDNKVMQKLTEQYGFDYCGIIHCWNGAERLAYHYCVK